MRCHLLDCVKDDCFVGDILFLKTGILEGLMLSSLCSTSFSSGLSLIDLIFSSGTSSFVFSVVCIFRGVCLCFGSMSGDGCFLKRVVGFWGAGGASTVVGV